jgi:hypothetical protein
VASELFDETPKAPRPPGMKIFGAEIKLVSKKLELAIALADCDYLDGGSNYGNFDTFSNYFGLLLSFY